MEGICFLLEAMNRKHRHLREAGMLQCLPQNAQIVGGPAGTTGLEQHDTRMVRVAESVLQCGNQLADNHNGRIAHIVMHIAQACINGMLVRHRRNHGL